MTHPIQAWEQYQEASKQLLAAAKYAAHVLANFKGSPSTDDLQAMVAAQQKLVEAIKAVEPSYYGAEVQL